MKIKSLTLKMQISFAVLAVMIGCVLIAQKGDIYKTKDTLKDFGLGGIIGSVSLAWFLANVKTTYDTHCTYADHPGPKRVSFWTGNYSQMVAAQSTNTLFDLFRGWILEHGDTICFWRNTAPKWITSDPDVIRAMLTEITIFKKTDAIPNRTLFGQRITGTSSFLTVTDGQMWATKRKIMSPYFTKIHLTDMFENCHDYIRRGMESMMTDVKLGETNVDLVWFYGELFQFFLGSLGFDMGTGLVSENAKFHNKVIQGILKWVPLQFGATWQVAKMRFDPEVNETISLIVKLRNICGQILKKKLIEYEEEGAKPDDIAHHVISSNKKVDVNKGVNEIWTYMMDDMMTIFLVIDNMAKTLSIMMVRLMREKRVYDKLCEEVRKADLTNLQTMDKSLRYTEMVILEILRLHPTLMRGIRVTNEEVKLNNGLTIPKKGMIFFGQLILHKHPNYWKNPLEFWPERFESGSKNITPFTYLPFVAGPRVCMGKHLAMMSMKMSIVHTLKNYDITPVPGTEKDMDFDYRFTIVRPTKGHDAIFTAAEEGA